MLSVHMSGAEPDWASFSLQSASLLSTRRRPPTTNEQHRRSDIEHHTTPERKGDLSSAAESICVLACSLLALLARVRAILSTGAALFKSRGSTAHQSTPPDDDAATPFALVRVRTTPAGPAGPMRCMLASSLARASSASPWPCRPLGRGSTCDRSSPRICVAPTPIILIGPRTTSAEPARAFPCMLSPYLVRPSSTSGWPCRPPWPRVGLAPVVTTR